MLRRGRKHLVSMLIAGVLIISRVICTWGNIPVEAAGQVSRANIRVSHISDVLTKPFQMGVNLEMSMISDEMWVDNGHWMEQTFDNSGIKIMRWGYDAWVFDWETETPILNNYQGGNNTKDDEGSFGLREFLAFCKKHDIIPLVDIPIESYDHRSQNAQTTGAESLARVKRLAFNMATYLNECGFDEVYFDMGNEPWSYVSCQYGGIPASTYGALFPDFYEIIKSVNPNYKLLLVHEGGAAAWNNAAEAATQGYYDGVDDHQYPRPNGWSNYYNKNDDSIFSNGVGGSTPSDKIKIMGECNLPWPNFPAYSYTLGSSIALLNGFLDLAYDDYYSGIITWPSHWPTSNTTANVGSAALPVGWFDTDAWYNSKETVRFNGPIYAEMIAGESVLDKAVWIYSDNVKVRVFAYTNTDESILKVIVLNKENSDQLDLNISLPRQYSAVNAMALYGTRNPSTNSAVEDPAPVYKSHFEGNQALESTTFTDTITYGECAVVYTFFNDVTATPGTFDFTSVEPESAIGTAHSFKWSPSENATNYHLVISENPALESPIIDVYTADETHFQPSADLDYNKDYYCKVTALNSTWMTDNSSGIIHFKTVKNRKLVNDTVTDTSADSYWSYSGNWRHQSYLGCLKGDDHVSRNAGSTATFCFNGERARIYGVKGDWCGKVDVYIDGVYDRTLDFYRENPVAQSTALPTQDMLYDTGHIGYGQHSIAMTVRADKNEAVNGMAYIELDYAEVFESSDDAIQYHTAAPVIETDLPETIEITDGGTYTLQVGCSELGDYTYEWYHDNRLLSVTTNGSYVITGASQETVGDYYVRVTNLRNGVSKTVKSSVCTISIGEAVSLSSFLQEARNNGFCYEYQGGSGYFDGSRIDQGSSDDIFKLKSSDKGTLIVRYRTNADGNQVIFAAGNNYQTNGYGAILVNNVPNVRKQRVDFPNGMYANLRGTQISGDWHTFLYSVDASNLPNTTAKTVTSFDGSYDTQFPNFASWYNANTTINDIQYLCIGGVNGTLANSGNNTGFIGDIEFVAFVPRFVTQDEAAVLTGQ